MTLCHKEVGRPWLTGEKTWIFEVFILRVLICNISAFCFGSTFVSVYVLFLCSFFIHSFIYSYVRTYVHIYVCVCIYIYTHTYTHIYTHNTYIHTYIHTYIPYRTIPYHTVLYYTIIYYNILYYTTLYYTVLLFLIWKRDSSVSIVTTWRSEHSKHPCDSRGFKVFCSNPQHTELLSDPMGSAAKAAGAWNLPFTRI